ncbi:MAG: AbgT family transporter, partial [Pseudomonadales bacterium]
MATDTNMMGQTGLLAAIERAGNRLPDPVFLFVYLILGLIVISVLCAWLGVNAAHPVLRDTEGAAVMVQATSLLSAENVARFWVEMPKTFTHFHPLGYVLVVMLGAGVAERSGFFGASIRAAVRHAPAALLTPVVAAVAMLSNHAADAGYVILIPVAAIIYVSAGRHPLAGVACAFAGVSGGFSANITPGALDALLFGITEAAVDGSGLAAGWTVNIAGNWWFIVALMALYLPIVWWVTDRIIEPRLGAWAPDVVEDLQAEVSGETDQGLQTRGLKRA